MPTAAAKSISVDPERYVALADAAALLGVSDRHLRRQCDEGLSTSGMAVMGVGPAGGRPGWWIDRRHDMRLAGGRLGELHQLPDLSAYPEAKRQEALDKARCVEARRSARQSARGLMCEWMPLLLDRLARRFPDLKLSQRTLQRWDAKYQRPADLTKLIDTRGGNRNAEPDPDAWDRFLTLFRALSEHIEAFNNSADHTREVTRGISPNEAYEEARLRQYATPDVVEQILSYSWTRSTVGRNGVTIRPLGKAIRYGNGAQVLLNYKGTGEEMYVFFDQQALGSVKVFDSQKRFVCEAASNDIGVSANTEYGREHLKKAQKLQRDMERATKLVAGDPAARLMSTATLAAREAHREVAARRRKRKARPPQERPVKLVQTPFDGQSKPLEQAELRRAAGAESRGTIEPMPSLGERMRSAARARGEKSLLDFAPPAGSSTTTRRQDDD